jgi:phage/plasmid primase-like uncharacterized protein
LPCLIAGIRDWQGTLVAVQRIFLAPDGQGKAPIAQPKMSLGPIKGASIHLQEPAGDHLVICEGPEDGLSLMAMLGLPVWVSAGATNLAALKFPPGVRSIVIGADNDATGHRQARLAGQAYAAQGIAVRILSPTRASRISTKNGGQMAMASLPDPSPSPGAGRSGQGARPAYCPGRLPPERQGPVGKTTTTTA